MNGYKRNLYIGTIVTTLGIGLSTIYGERIGLLGIAFIVIGGLSLFAGIKGKKRKEKLGKSED